MTVAFDTKAQKKMAHCINYLDLSYDGTPLSEMKVKQITSEIARPYIASFHYSHTMPDSTRFVYGGYLNGKLCGIVCYGMGCGKNQYTALIPNIQNGQYIELTRLWCANDYPRNTESRLISQSLKMLPSDIKLVLSFADEAMGHVGTIYQATNWYYCGRSNGGKQLISSDGLKKHTRLLGIYRMRHHEYKDMDSQQLRDVLGYEVVEGGQKYRYVYLRGTKKEKKEMYRQIKPKILPYPKMPKKTDMHSDQEMLAMTNTETEQMSLFDIM